MRRLISEEDLTAMQTRVRSTNNCTQRGGGRVGVAGGTAVPRANLPSSSPPFKPFTLALVGQMISGKNRVLVRRDGKHIPKKQFINWRTDMHFQILEQRPALPPAIVQPVALLCEYWPGDERTRDADGQLSALFHLLVYAKVLKDDGLIYDVTWHRYRRSDFPKLIMEIMPWA